MMMMMMIVDERLEKIGIESKLCVSFLQISVQNLACVYIIMIGYLLSILNLTLVEIGPEIEIQNY
jgi:hypothetical protein